MLHAFLVFFVSTFIREATFAYKGIARAVQAILRRGLADEHDDNTIRLCCFREPVPF